MESAICSTENPFKPGARAATIRCKQQHIPGTLPWPLHCKPTCRWRYSPGVSLAQDPLANPALNDEAMRNLKAAWPVFEQARIASAWAGTIDVTPDSNPVIGPVATLPGLTLATGFSGHGFGTSPAAGQLAADLVSQAAPLIDPAPYRFERFT